jgi:hypothetical protein
MPHPGHGIRVAAWAEPDLYRVARAIIAKGKGGQRDHEEHDWQPKQATYDIWKHTNEL